MLLLPISFWLYILSVASKVSFIKASSATNVIYFFVGVASAIPYAYPDDPVYITPFLGLLLLSILGKSRLRSGWRLKLLCIAILIFYGSLVNLLVGASGEAAVSLVGFIAIVTLSFAYFFSSRPRNVLLGFSFAIFILTVYMIFLIISFGYLPDYLSLRIFASSQRRFLADYLLGWPNAFAAMQIIAAFCLKEFKFKNLALFVALSSLLTTSRSSIFGLILFLFPSSEGSRPAQKARFLILSVISALFLLFLFSLIPDDLIDNRLLKSEDRSVIFSFLFQRLADNPFGYGNISIQDLGANFSYESFHNSFLKVALRYGFVGVLSFLFLVLPSRLSELFSDRYRPCLFLILVSMFQDFILQANLFFVYFVYLALLDDDSSVAKGGSG